MNSKKIIHAGHHLGFFSKGMAYSGLTIFLGAFACITGCGVLGLTMLGVDVITAINLSDGFEDIANATMSSAHESHDNFSKAFHHCAIELDPL